jgi:hypothetical protein
MSMSDVFYLRAMHPPVDPAELSAMAEQAESCFSLHRVDWKLSFVALDGSEMLCWYRAPDAESARSALRQAGSDMGGVWAGYPDPSLSPSLEKGLEEVTVLVEQAHTPGSVDTAASNVDNAIRQNSLGLICRIRPTDEHRYIWLLAAAEAHDVDQAMRTAGAGFARATPVRLFKPQGKVTCMHKP